MRGTQKGFTLVEIAIVLVIIGLLLGGILKGQEMITQAKIKNVVADFSGVSAAYYGYQDRYRAIPGDDSNANTRWTLGITTAGGGVAGDGIVAGAYNSTMPDVESRLFWLHLRSAGFVAGTGQAQPFNAVTGMLGIQTGDAASPTAPAATLLNQGGGNGFVGLIICSANLPDKIAIAVDTQMDDGASNTGTVRAIAQASPNPTIAAAQVSASAYAETGTNVYTVCRSL